MTKKINSIQCALMLCLTTISLKFLTYPSVFASYTYKDVYVPLLIGLILDVLFTTIVLAVIKRNPNITFYELLVRSFGKILAKIVVILLAVYFFFKGLLIVKEIHNYFNETLFENIKWFSFVIPLFAILGFMMLKDFRTFGRTIQMFMPLMVFALLFTVLVPATETDFSNILPLFENGFSAIFTAVVRCSFSFGDYLILFLLMGKLNYKSNTQKVVFTCVAITDVLVLLFYIVFSAIFGNIGINHSLALGEVLLYTNINTQTGTINWLNIIIWLIILFLEAGLMFLCSSKALTEVFNFKNKYVPCLIICSLLFGSIVYLYLNLIRAIQIVTSLIFSSSIIIFQVTLPIICIFATIKLKGKNQIKLVNCYKNKVVKYQLTNIVAGKSEQRFKSVITKPKTFRVIKNA